MPSDQTHVLWRQNLGEKVSNVIITDHDRLESFAQSDDARGLIVATLGLLEITKCHTFSQFTESRLSFENAIFHLLGIKTPLSFIDD